MPTNEGRDPDDANPADFSVAITMRGQAAHLAVKGPLDADGTETLETLLDRLPAVDVTEVVLDLTETAGDRAALGELVEEVRAGAPRPLHVTVAGADAPGTGE